MTAPPRKRTRRKAADRAKAGEPQPHSAKIERMAIPSVDDMPPPALDPDYVPSGPGRPQEHRYHDLFESMQAPPVGDPYELAVWCMSANAIAMFETAQGRGNYKLNAELRAFAGVIGRLIPTERVRAAEKSLEAHAAPPKPGMQRGAKMTPKDKKSKGLRR